MKNVTVTAFFLGLSLILRQGHALAARSNRGIRPIRRNHVGFWPTALQAQDPTLQKSGEFVELPETQARELLEKRKRKYSDDGFTLSTPLRYSVNDWWKHIATFPQSKVLRRVRSHLLFNTIWSCFLAVASYKIPAFLPNVLKVHGSLNLNVPFQLSGGILGILLAFRTSQSYQRFWHGREVWAKVINQVRSFARCLCYLDSPVSMGRDAYMRWLKTFPVCLMQHVQGERDPSALIYLLPHERRIIDSGNSMPLACTLALSQLINRVQTLSSEQNAAELVWWQFEFMLAEMSHTIGEAEALAGTPVPITYSAHASRMLTLWTMCMPLVMLQHLPPFMVPIATISVSWMLLATEEIGHLIEEPFGLHNDRPQLLPLQRYCDIIIDELQDMEVTRSELEAYGASEFPNEDDSESMTDLCNAPNEDNEDGKDNQK